MLKGLSVAKWKYLAKEHVRRSSWHHTSTFFNETDHYDLVEVAEKAIELFREGELETQYSEHLKDLKAEKKELESNVSYGVMEVQVWGGSRKRPVLMGTETMAGVIKGDWLYSKELHTKEGEINRNKTNANKVLQLDKYDSYKQLVKEHEEFKGSVTVFNALKKEVFPELIKANKNKERDR